MGGAQGTYALRTGDDLLQLLDRLRSMDPGAPKVTLPLQLVRPVTGRSCQGVGRPGCRGGAVIAQWSCAGVVSGVTAGSLSGRMAVNDEGIVKSAM